MTVPVKDLKRPKFTTTARIPVILVHEMLHFLREAWWPHENPNLN